MATSNITFEAGDGARASISIDPPSNKSQDQGPGISFQPTKQTLPIALGTKQSRDRVTLARAPRSVPQRFQPQANPARLRERVASAPAPQAADHQDFGFGDDDVGSESSLGSKKKWPGDGHEFGGSVDDSEDGGGGGGEASDDEDNAYEPEPELRPSEGFKSLDDEKADLLFRLGRMRQRASIVDGMPFSVHSDIRDLRAEVTRVRRSLDLDNSLAWQRQLLTTVVTGLEWASGRWGKDMLDIDLDGFSEHTYENIHRFDDVFERLHEKYKGSGGNWPPELVLMMTLAGSAIAFNIGKKTAQPQMQAPPTYQHHAPPPPPQQQQDAGGRREMRGPPDVSGVMGNLGGMMGGGMASNFNPLSMLLGGGLAGGMPQPQATRMARPDEVHEVSKSSRRRRRHGPRSESSYSSSSGGESAMLSDDGNLSLPSMGGMSDLGDFEGLGNDDAAPAPAPKRARRVVRL